MPPERQLLPPSNPRPIDHHSPTELAMTERTIVHLVRHGEVHNPTGILYGRLPDYHLSDRGREMADAAATWLDGRDVTHLVSSPLERARETAAPIANSTGLEIAIDERVIEAGNQFEGNKFGKDAASLIRPATWWKLRNPARPSWGESYRDISERMQRAIADARASADGHEAVIVSHQLPVWIARRTFERRRFLHDPRSRQCGLASVTSFTFDGDEFVSVEYSEPAAHLIGSTGKFVGGA
jgi:broad specificity phosphatase PhoE